MAPLSRSRKNKFTLKKINEQLPHIPRHHPPHPNQVQPKKKTETPISFNSLCVYWVDPRHLLLLVGNLEMDHEHLSFHVYYIE